MLFQKINEIRDMIAINQATLICTVCRTKEGTYVCVDCRQIYCVEHVHDQFENHSVSHLFYYDLKSNNLYCKRCKKCHEIYDDFDDHHYSIEPKYFCDYQIKGIQNFGKTDFISAPLQAILNTEGIIDYYLSKHHNLEECDAFKCPDCFFKIIYSMIYSNRAIDLSKNIYMMTLFDPSIISKDVNDAIIAYELIINTYHFYEAAEECDCPLHQNFFGKIQLLTRCVKCGEIKNDLFEFSYLSLNLNFNIRESIDEFFSQKIIKAKDNHYKCCKGAFFEKRTIVKLYPKILTLYFKRFQDGSEKRINCKMKVSNKLRIEDNIYEIYGFIEHRGKYPGEYFTYLYLNGSWFEINNERVIKDVMAELKICNALIVFYKLREKS